MPRAYLRSILSKVKIEPKQCFRNCQAIFLEDAEKRMAYVEGLLHSSELGNLPHKHAWLLIDGQIFDPTLAASGYTKGMVGYQEVLVTRHKV
jgi:hypothetical protein